MAAFVALSAGCASRPAPGAPERVVVREDTLVRRHPLWAQYERLAQTEAALSAGIRQIETPPATGLTPLVVATQSLRTAEARALSRRRDARARTDMALKQGFADYVAGARGRLDRALEDRRTDLEAQSRAELAQQERDTIDGIEAGVRDRITRLRDDIALSRAAEDALSVQLGPLAEVRLPQPAAAILEADIKKLRDAGLSVRIEGEGFRRAIAVSLPGEPGLVSNRARLEASRRLIAALRLGLENQVNEIASKGESDRREALLAMERRSQEAVEARLEQIRGENEPVFLRQELEDRLERTLAIEASPAEAYRRLTPAALPVLGDLPRTIGANHVGAGGVSTMAQRQRLASRRRELGRWIVDDIAAGVRDIASARHWEVASSAAPRFVGAPDRTDEVASVLFGAGGSRQ